MGFGGSAEGVCALRGDDADALQDGFAGIAAEDGWVADPLKGGLQVCVEGVHGLGVDGGGRGDGISL